MSLGIVEPILLLRKRSFLNSEQTMTKPNISLYFCRDSRAIRPLWALEELALPYELINMDFPPRYRVENYKEINELGTVPTLTDGDVTLTESSAMGQYLVDKYAPNSSLIVNSHEQAYGEYLNWMYRSDATFTFPQTIYLRYARFEKPENQKPEVAEDYIIWLFARLRSVDNAIENKEYLCADRFTLADINVGYALYLAKVLGFENRMSEQAKRYLANLMNRPAFQRCLEHQAHLAEVF